MNQNEEKGLMVGLSVWLLIPLFVIANMTFMMIFGGITHFIISFVLHGDIDHLTTLEQIIMQGSLLLSALLAAAVMLRLECRPFADLGLSMKGRLKDWGYGFLFAAVLYLVGFGVSVMWGAVEVVDVYFRPMELAASLFFFLLVALFEEITMRGYVLGRLLHTRLPKFVSLFISSVLFALLHLFNPNVAILPIINLVLAGMLLGASYLYTRNLCFPISLHLFWNWIQGPLLGYKVSGTEIDTPLLTLRLSQADALHGGAFGFEGSLLCTFLIVVGILLIVWWGERQVSATPEKLPPC